jgi:DNA-binding NarL/FixJ family response regulator
MVVDDHYVVREGVRRLLEESGEVQVVGCFGSAEEMWERVEELAPDVVVTDIRMPPGHHMEGIEAARRLRAERPHVGVVVLSQYSHESYAYELLKDGTAGLAYLLKDRVGEPDHLLAAVREVGAGRSMIDSEVVDALVLRHSRREESGLESLTPRELDVLHQMAQGKNNAGIASALVLSASAVEKHVSSILAKLGRPGEDGVDRRVAAVLRFLQG